jgi:hypothetical protein
VVTAIRALEHRVIAAKVEHLRLRGVNSEGKYQVTGKAAAELNPRGASVCGAKEPLAPTGINHVSLQGGND